MEIFGLPKSMNDQSSPYTRFKSKPLNILHKKNKPVVILLRPKPLQKPESKKPQEISKKLVESDSNNNSKTYNDFFNKGIQYRNKQLFNQAIIEFGKAIKLKPNSPVAYFNRGLCWRCKNKINKAISDFDKAIQLDPQGFNSYLNRASLLLQKGELEASITDYTKALELNPQSTAARGKLIEALISIKSLEKASKYIEPLQNSKQSLPLYFFYKAQIEKNQSFNNDSLALKLINNAIRLSPNFPSFYKFRIEIYNSRFNPSDQENIKKDLDKIIQLDPNDPDANYALGGLKKDSDPEQAKKHFFTALEGDFQTYSDLYLEQNQESWQNNDDDDEIKEFIRKKQKELYPEEYDDL